LSDGGTPTHVIWVFTKDISEAADESEVAGAPLQRDLGQVHLLWLGASVADLAHESRFEGMLLILTGSVSEGDEGSFQQGLILAGDVREHQGQSVLFNPVNRGGGLDGLHVVRVEALFDEDLLPVLVSWREARDRHLSMGWNCYILRRTYPNGSSVHLCADDLLPLHVDDETFVLEGVRADDAAHAEALDNQSGTPHLLLTQDVAKNGTSADTERLSRGGAKAGVVGHQAGEFSSWAITDFTILGPIEQGG
jgi:hypothetical protein